MNDRALQDALISERRFGGIARLYGDAATQRLAQAHVCVVGIGGVGSWAAEALARSGVGHLRLIDLDHVAESNINRQAHALEDTLGQAKVLAMRERIAAINPQARVEVVEAFVEPDTALEHVRGTDMVIDAIDSVRAKVALIVACRELGVPLVVAGGAGGKRDPGRIRVGDLARTEQDPLLAKVRQRLRAQHGFPRDPKRRFGVPVVFSDEPVRQPEAACNTSGLQGLACAGYGSSMMMTASVGLSAAACAVETLLQESPRS